MMAEHLSTGGSNTPYLFIIFIIANQIFACWGQEYWNKAYTTYTNGLRHDLGHTDYY